MSTSTDASATPTYDPPDSHPVDVFAKVRGHEREQLLHAAREADVLPYFHVLTSAAMPVVEMEGAERIMLGSNNYLGLTSDERVMKGAEDALHRYGTGLTGSRFLNGTIPLHLELEQEIAEWMNTDAALVFTTGHQANLSTLGTCSHARSCARSVTTASTSSRRCCSALRPTAAASWSSSTGSSRWRATSRRCARSATCARATARV
jgi:7-keto-8-aminopelargonate synthetase-like enzyme